jgi:hypothetical protein
MEYFIELLIVLGLGLYLGWKLSARFHLGLFKMILEDLNISNKDLVNMVRKHGAEFITSEQEAKLNEAEEDGLERIEIKVEKHSETLYAFRKDNDQFLGQGTSREDLIAAMGQKMKNVRLIIVEGDEHLKSEAS